MRSWVLHELWPEWPSSNWFLLEPCKAKTSPFGCCTWICKSSGLSVQRDAGVGLGPSRELSYHPNTCSPQPRKAKVCLQVMNKRFLLSEKYFSLGRGMKPGPLFAFQGKRNPLFVSSTLAVDKMWMLRNTPQSAVLSLLWCFAVIWLCRSYPRQLRECSLLQPAFLLQDLSGEMPVDAALLPVPAWRGPDSPSSPAQLGWTGNKWMSKSS